MIEERIIVGEGGEYPLKGMIALPEGADEPVPAVVMLHGSGSSDMDERVLKCTPFKDLAAGLAERGIASIRYDKRSFVYGRKMVKSGMITVREEAIEDAVLAAELIKKDPRVDSGRVFLLGHSMGAMIAPRVDAEGGDFRGLILMAGTPRNLEEVLIDQNEAVKKSAKGLVKWIIGKQVEKMTGKVEGLNEMSDDEAKAISFGGGVTLYYFKEMGAHPAGAYLKATDKPLLVMQGSRDFQVNAEKDFNLYEEILEGKDATFVLYEGLNHVFVPAVTDDIMKLKQEYGKERHIGAEVFDDIAEWIKRY